MNVQVYLNPKNPKGLALKFPYDAGDVLRIKQVLGTHWDPKLKTWLTDGPEPLLEFQRFGIHINYLSPEAKSLAEEFRYRLWRTIDSRTLIESDELFAYQEQGTEFLSLMPFSILGDDRGTGKTKQALDACAAKGYKRILVLVTPKTVTYNWPYEIETWQPQYTSGVLPDTAKERVEFWANQPDIVIANYEKIRLTDWPEDFYWDVIITDELPRVAKNSTTIIHKILKRMFRNTECVWVLTGSPMEKALKELYNIFSLLRPAVLGNYMRFRDQHLEMDWAGNIVGVKNLDLLRDRIGPYMLRRTKKEVLKFLPGKLPEKHFARFSRPELAAYQEMTSKFDPNNNQFGLEKEDNPLTQMLRMRQFCCTPMLFPNAQLGRGCKFEALQEKIEEWDGRVVVFCFFEEVISLLHEWLDLPPDAMISGKVPAKQRIENIMAFNQGKLGKVLVSTDAGSVGVNITGANLIIHYDQVANNQTMLQREDRLDRIGQEDTVTVMHLMCMDSIDYGQYLANKEEEKLFEDIVDGAEIAMLRKLDAPRLKRLVEGRL